MSKILEAKGPLNIGENEVSEPIGNMHPCDLAETLLTTIIELLFSCLRPDGKQVDFEKLEKTPEFKKYKSTSAALETVHLLSILLTFLR